jgi:hypothetical protein
MKIQLVIPMLAGYAATLTGLMLESPSAQAETNPASYSILFSCKIIDNVPSGLSNLKM